MRTLKLYATGSATGNGVATITIPSASRIRGVQWSVRYDSITDNAALDLEISRSSAREIAVLGAQQCISEVCGQNNLLTSGMTAWGIDAFFPVDVEVVQGQIVYLHAVVTGTLSFTATAIIHYG